MTEETLMKALRVPDPHAKKVKAKTVRIELPQEVWDLMKHEADFHHWSLSQITSKIIETSYRASHTPKG